VSHSKKLEGGQAKKRGASGLKIFKEFGLAYKNPDGSWIGVAGTAVTAGGLAILAHLRCVKRAIRRGGLYVFDRYMCSSWTEPARRWSWTRQRGSTTVRARMRPRRISSGATLAPPHENRRRLRYSSKSRKEMFPTV
jgi:hypothetical protein